MKKYQIRWIHTLSFMAQNWDKDLWSLDLPFLLNGKTREMFGLLSSEDRLYHDKLKLTDTGYKNKFRN